MTAVVMQLPEMGLNLKPFLGCNPQKVLCEERMEGTIRPSCGCSQRCRAGGFHAIHFRVKIYFLKEK